MNKERNYKEKKETDIKGWGGIRKKEKGKTLRKFQ